MKKYLLLLFIGLFGSTCAQKTFEDIPIMNPIMNIPGTRVYINVVSPYTLSDNFTGIVKENTAIIQVFDLIGGNYYTNAETFTKETFEKKGAIVQEYIDTTISGYPAKFVSFENDQNQIAFSLVYGDTTFSAMLMGICGSNDKLTAQEIREMILTSSYDVNTKIDPLKIAPFTINDKKSKFKFVKYTSSTYFYSLDGKEKESNGNEPFINISIVPAGEDITLSSISETVISSLEKYGFVRENSNVKMSEKINGHDAMEIILNGKLGTTNTTIYLLTVLNNNQSLVFQGYIRDNVKQTIEEMRKFAKTIEFKKK